MSNNDYNAISQKIGVDMSRAGNLDTLLNDECTSVGKEDAQAVDLLVWINYSRPCKIMEEVPGQQPAPAIGGFHCGGLLEYFCQVLAMVPVVRFRRFYQRVYLQELFAPAGEPDITQFFRPITKGRIPHSHVLLSGVSCQSSTYRSRLGHPFNVYRCSTGSLSLVFSWCKVGIN
jgi:hypothetical protein